MKTIIPKIGLACIGALLILPCQGISATAKDQPNIVIFMADDFGLGSSEPYGANTEVVRTPALAQLARQGLTFDRAYVTASVCSPTRYGLLTGRYSWRSRMKHGVVNSFDPMLIETDRPTIASFLKNQGYRTAQIGKWHLGYKSKPFKNLLGEISPGPNDLGFDYHFGVPNNMDDIHKVYIENDQVHGLRSNKISSYGKSFYGRPYTGYDAPQRNEVEVMETLTRKAIEWLDSGSKPDQPFFLYFASVAVHHPIMPSERMRGTSDGGAYGDFIHDLDYAVGELMTALSQRGLMENTLFIFTSDNGGDLPKEATRPEIQAQAAGLAANGNLRGDKHTIYEGGLRVPMIASWPMRIGANRRTEAFVTTADLFATLSELLTGKDSPGAKAAPDSFSFASVLTGSEDASTRPHGVFRDAKGRKAVRFGNWKLVDDTVAANPEQKVPLELYNLEKDPVEEHNLATAYPDITLRGKELLDSIVEADSSRKVELD